MEIWRYKSSKVLKVFLPFFTEWLCSCEAPWTPCNPFLPSVSTAVYTHTPHTHTHGHIPGASRPAKCFKGFIANQLYFWARERDRVPGSLYLNVCVSESVLCVTCSTPEANFLLHSVSFKLSRHKAKHLRRAVYMCVHSKCGSLCGCAYLRAWICVSLWLEALAK